MLGWSRMNRGDAVRLGPREREVPRAALDVLGLPVGRPVPVHVVAAGRVLVDLAVAVVVDPFEAELLVFPLLAGLDGDEQSGVVGRELEAAVGVLLPHLGDLAVAVEVVVPVLVEQAVAVVVAGRLAAPRAIGRVRPGEPVGPAVGVDRRDDVERLLIQELGDLLDPPVVLGQVPDQIEASLGRLDLVAVDVAIDVHGRLGPVAARLGVVDRHAPHVPPLDALAQAGQAEQVGMGGDQLFQGRFQLRDSRRAG